MFEQFRYERSRELILVQDYEGSPVVRPPDQIGMTTIEKAALQVSIIALVEPSQSMFVCHSPAQLLHKRRDLLPLALRIPFRQLHLPIQILFVIILILPIHTAKPSIPLLLLLCTAWHRQLLPTWPSYKICGCRRGRCDVAAICSWL